MSSPRLRIAIIGGGPAGLNLGLLLHRRGIPFTIFELRPRPTDEDLAKPAGSLDMHEESGLAAIRACDLYDEFTTLTGDCTESQVIADKAGTVIYTDEGEGSNRPEISRHKIIQLLLSHLPVGSIKWGHKLLSAKSSTTSGYTEIKLDFGDDGTHTFDLVVGADGAWSRVRAMLTTEKPRYAGIQNITLNIRHITANHPHLAKLIGTGTFTCLADYHGVFSQRSVDDSTRIYVMLSTANEHFAATHAFDGKDPAQAKDILLSDALPFGDWGANIRELIAVACDDEAALNPDAPIDIKPLYTLPVGHSWPHRPGATLVGDAAHLTNPPAGEGVNIAMQDALLLAQAIAKAHESAGEDAAGLRDTLDASIEKFEREMVPRAKEMADGSLEVGEMMFGAENGARTMADWFLSFR